MNLTFLYAGIEGAALIGKVFAILLNPDDDLSLQINWADLPPLSLSYCPCFLLVGKIFYR
jgi:hypothetical protein